MALKNNPEKIGNIAVDTLSNFLQRSEHLDPKIQKHDKNLSWDGGIDYYIQSPFSRENFKGHVPTQVKGHIVNAMELEKEKITFSVEIGDVRNFVASRGVIFFVIYLTEIGNYIDTKIYYNSLLPYDLHEILNHYSEQKTRVLEFLALPREIDDVEIIFRDFLSDQRKQSNTVIYGKTDKVFSAVNQYTFSLPSKNGIPYFDERPRFIYQTLMGSVSVPLMKGIFDTMRIKDVPLVTYINGREYFRHGEIVLGRKNKIEEIIVNPGLRFRNLSHGKKTGSVDSDKECTFQQMADNLKFIKLATEGGEIRVGDILTVGELSFSQSADELNRDIIFYERIQKLLTHMHVAKQVHVSAFSDNELYEMNSMFFHIVERVPYEAENSVFGRWTCGPLKNFIISRQADDGYYLYDAFQIEQENFEMSLDEGDHRFASSLYVMLSVDDYINLDNIDYDVVEQSLINVPYSENYGMVAVNTLLRILMAYDHTTNFRLLEIAEKLSCYLLGHADNISNFINRMQVIRRKREFTTCEIAEIMKRRTQTSDQDESAVFYHAGFAALLGNKGDVTFYKGQMTSEQLEQYEMFPINNLVVT
ncbi:hypothetical protein [Selenomonas noxia]|jgi:hypothetical protein|uniref:hypothetical protein n=1 Tax=Selenomonas noxia TaxID=135083 RepID=UPI00235922C9|nr:hypothetical protein [Selenomonas noxia]